MQQVKQGLLQSNAAFRIRAPDPNGPRTLRPRQEDQPGFAPFPDDGLRHLPHRDGLQPLLLVLNGLLHRQGCQPSWPLKTEDS